MPVQNLVTIFSRRGKYVAKNSNNSQLAFSLDQQQLENSGNSIPIFKTS